MWTNLEFVTRGLCCARLYTKSLSIEHEEKHWKIKKFLVWTSMCQAKGGDKGIWLENVNQLSFE
jgi:hypothetical protein